MVKKIKVVFLGSRPLGAYALRLLLSMENIEVVACVVKKPGPTAWWDDDPFFIAKNPLDSHEKLCDIEFDLGVSINYWKIMPNELILPPRLGFINIHHAFNLSLRGRNMTTRAIIGARKTNRWFHGSCLHYTDDGLDTGPIIASSACDISEFDTGWSLFSKVEKLGELLISEWFPRLTIAKIPTAFPGNDQPLEINSKGRYDKRFIKNIKNNPLMSYDIIRAYDFNGFFEQAYTFEGGEKIYLTINKEGGSNVLLKIDSDRKIYQFCSNVKWVNEK